MQTINPKTLYRCEICGAISEDKEKIEQCEKKGKPEPLVNKGDVIYFKDCKETPLLYGRNEMYLPKRVITVIDRARIFFNILNPYKVKDIIIDGHHIEYVLSGTKGKSADWSATDNFEQWYHYPTIYGNKFMKEILDKYN